MYVRMRDSKQRVGGASKLIDRGSKPNKNKTKNATQQSKRVLRLLASTSNSSARFEVLVGAATAVEKELAVVAGFLRLRLPLLMLLPVPPAAAMVVAESDPVAELRTRMILGCARRLFRVN